MAVSDSELGADTTIGSTLAKQESVRLVSYRHRCHANRHVWSDMWSFPIAASDRDLEPRQGEPTQNHMDY